MRLDEVKSIGTFDVHGDPSRESSTVQFLCEAFIPQGTEFVRISKRKPRGEAKGKPPRKVRKKTGLSRDGSP